MCRHLAYLGPPASLAALLYGRPHALEHQAYAPREQRNGTVNADGFGAGWYPGPPPAPGAPLRYRRSLPIWGDASFADAASALTAQCAVAAVRDATPGFGSDESGAQPFRGAGRLFSHNGAADDDAALFAALGAPVPDVLDTRAPVDSAAVFAEAVRCWLAGADTAAGLARAAVRAAAAARGRYTLLAADGARLAAVVSGDTLYAGRLEPSGVESRAAASGPGGLPSGDGAGGTVLSSEPLDNHSAWRRLPEGSVVVADAGGVRWAPLSALAAGAAPPWTAVGLEPPSAPEHPAGGSGTAQRTEQLDGQPADTEHPHPTSEDPWPTSRAI
ncbi:class II glutamine amidotransferase [Nocardiopsis coralliicola]